MKILQVIPFYLPALGFGGPVKVCSQISEQLVRDGHQVTVVTTDAFDAKTRIEKKKETINSVIVIRFKNISPALAKEYNVYTPNLFRVFIKHHLKDYQLVHIHAFFTYLNIVTVYYCRNYKIPYILHLHESPVPLPLLKKVLFKKIFNIFFGRSILLSASKILVVSAREKEILCHYMPELQNKIEILPNSFDASSPSNKVLTERSEYNLHASDKVILCLTRLSFIKGLDRLIKAFAKLYENDSSYKLIIAGPNEGEELSKLKLLCSQYKIEQAVLFMGFVDTRQRDKLYQIADIFALFSAYESFSLTTLEAVAAGLPVCISKEIGIASDIMTANCGIIVKDTNNPSQAANCLKMTYEKKIARKNRDELFMKFSPVKIMAQLENIYQSVIKNYVS